MARGENVGDGVDSVDGVDGVHLVENRGGACNARDADALDALDASLSCPICGAGFSTPLLLTVCGHSFCAACIRENFDYQERTTVKEGGRLGCPSCRKACAHRDLVANLVLRDVVTEYGKAEAGLRHRLELAEAREEQARERSRERARHAKKRRKRREADRMNDVDGQENGGGIEERGTSPDVVCLDDQAGSDEDGSPCSASACVSEDDSLSSGEEYDPRDRGKKDAQGRDAVKSGEAKAGTGGTAGPGTTASSFMACPICGKNVHHMYMNSHIDACLVGGGRSGSGKVDRERAAAQPALVVPPKLVLLGALNNSSNEKKLKNELKKYNISTEGCASARELLDRYMRFRTAVEVSNDKGEEGASYEKIVFRMMKEERSKKMAGMFGGRRSSRAEGTAGAANPIGEPCAAQCQRVCGQDGQPSLTLAPIAWTKSNTSKKKVVIDMTGDVAREGGLLTEAPRRFDPSQINLSEIRHPREILLPEDATFEEMVAVTRLRDRVRIMLLKEFNDV